MRISLPKPVPIRLRPAKRWAYVILTSGLILSGYAALAIFASEGAAKFLFDFTSPLWSLFAAAGLFQAARSIHRRSVHLASAWYLLSIALLANVLGDLTWAILENVLEEPPFPSIADAFYLAYYPLLMIAIFRMTVKNTSSWERMKTQLDIVAIMLAAALIFWNFSLGSIFLSSLSESFSTLALSLAYPLGDLALLYCVLRLMYHDRRWEDKTARLLLVAAGGITFVTDFIFFFQTARDAYSSGGLLDIG